MTDNPRERHRRRVQDQRAGEYCPRCGRAFDQTDGDHVHHRDGNERNGAPGNLRKRCPKCHIGAEHDRPDEVETPGQPSGPRRSRPSRPRTSPR